MLHVHRIQNAADLPLLKGDWNRLARDVPFRRFDWHAQWWRHFSTQARQLYVLAVYDEQNAVCGIAPWYVEQTGARGRTISWLGSGRVCSDYQTILAADEHLGRVTTEIADWLTHAAGDAENGWDLLHLDAVVTGDAAMDQFVSELWSAGNTIHREAGANCWRIALPANWEDYVAGLSKSHRKNVRRLQRQYVEAGRTAFQVVETAEQLACGLEILVDLHQRRWQSVGEPGCFADESFTGFIRDVAHQMLASGNLQLNWLEIDGVAAAVEFQLIGGGVTYAYQAGLNPDLLDDEPGRIINIASIRHAIEQRHTGYDFLRGDEPYKAHWRAQPRATTTYRVVPSRTLAKARHGLWLAGDSLKSWVKTGLELTGMK